MFGTIGIIYRDLKDDVDMISSFMKEVVSFVSWITQKNQFQRMGLGPE